MEAKHIKAVKKPWQRTNRVHLLNQILYINQHLDKLHAMQIDFTNQGMLELMGLQATLDIVGVFSIRPLLYKSYSENTEQVMHIKLENSDNKLKANSQIYKGTENDDDDYDNEYNSEDEADIDEVATNLVSSCLSLGKRVCESIYLTLHLYNLILASTQEWR